MNIENRYGKALRFRLRSDYIRIRTELSSAEDGRLRPKTIIPRNVIVVVRLRPNYSDEYVRRRIKSKYFVFSGRIRPTRSPFQHEAMNYFRHIDENGHILPLIIYLYKIVLGYKIIFVYFFLQVIYSTLFILCNYVNLVGVVGPVFSIVLNILNFIRFEYPFKLIIIN